MMVETLTIVGEFCHLLGLGSGPWAALLPHSPLLGPAPGSLAPSIAGMERVGLGRARVLGRCWVGEGRRPSWGGESSAFLGGQPPLLTTGSAWLAPEYQGIPL